MEKSTAGNFLEDFRAGQEIRHATPRTLTEGDAALYLALTGSRFAQACSAPLAQANGLPLIEEWAAAGHGVGNHTAGHLNLSSPQVTLSRFIADVERADAALRELPTFMPLLRFPYLKEGDTLDKRDGMRQWMREHQYRVAPVSIDTSDWYYNQRYLALRIAMRYTQRLALDRRGVAHRREKAPPHSLIRETREHVGQQRRVARPNHPHAHATPTRGGHGDPVGLQRRPQIGRALIGYGGLKHFISWQTHRRVPSSIAIPRTILLLLAVVVAQEVYTSAPSL